MYEFRLVFLAKAGQKKSRDLTCEYFRELLFHYNRNCQYGTSTTINAWCSSVYCYSR